MHFWSGVTLTLGHGSSDLCSVHVNKSRKGDTEDGLQSHFSLKDVQKSNFSVVFFVLECVKKLLRQYDWEILRAKDSWQQHMFTSLRITYEIAAG